MLTNRPFGTSTDCLNCHDGAFAEDVHRGGERRDQGGFKAIQEYFDQMETKLGTDPERTSEVPDHPVAVFYPRKPNGELLPDRPVSSQRRYFAIPDLQDEQMVMPITGSTSKFFLQTPGNPQTPPPRGNGNGNGNGQVLAASPADSDAAGGGAEQFRLIHTTFGVIHCDSCHNAHSELHAGFLRDKSPQLCLLCHDR